MRHQVLMSRTHPADVALGVMGVLDNKQVTKTLLLLTLQHVQLCVLSNGLYRVSHCCQLCCTT